ncbi:cation transporter [Vibrio maerlii]|uniref:cation transporter n=1 Tax=Vibrio maerlii TaxID=2231648 RepID=UPI000E3EC7F7|nr:copper-translocating P-type ATPase [Vibrio maerlii]
MTQFAISLSGLNCMGCARKVERALNEQHSVEITELSPTLIKLDTDATLKQIADTVAGLGYQAGNQYHFHLSGLNCGRCVKKLTEHLDGQTSVIEFEVTKTELTIRTLLTEQEVIALVEEVGYQATTEAPIKEAVIAEKQEPILEQEKTPPAPSHKEQVAPTPESQVQLLIQGMTCASCVASVEKALTKVEGVVKAQVNLAEQSALVFTSQDSSFMSQAITDSVKQAGYNAEVLEDASTLQQKQAAQHAEQQKRFKKDAIAGLVVGAPLMLWGVLGGNMMIRLSPDQTISTDQAIWGTIGVLCFVLLATAGKLFFTNAWQSFKHGRATMDSLVALGTGAAWFYSMLVVAMPQWFPEPSRHVYFEASAMIIGLISLGHFIEAKAKANTTKSLQALLNLQPQSATLITERGDQQVSIEAIQLGMKLRIKPGEKIPVDGVVVDGESYIDEAMLTGEPIPVLKTATMNVSAGTLNTDGALVIEATGIGANTMLSRIIRMVRSAQSSKPAIAKLADQIASVFVPVVVGIAAIAALVWFIWGPEPKASYMLVVTTTVLIIACPCALGLATPLSVTVGVGKAAELGVLIKDADALQIASKVDTVVFDKTGTLTQGKPKVQKVFTTGITQDELLALAYGLETQSEHPLAKAICQYALDNKIKALAVSDFLAHRGKGVVASFEGEKVQLGSIPYFESEGISLVKLESAIQESAQQAWTPIVIAQNNQALGLIAISDSIREDAKAAISALNRQGINTIMLTGDNPHVANAIGKQLGINEVIAQVLPEEKASHIKRLKTQGNTVAMVGDGINDAPALATADLGIAMGGGSDVAIESAQMTILNTSPIAVVHALELSRATLKNMKQNLFGAFIYNSLGIPVAAGVLFPAFGFLLSPVVAGLAMALSSITVVSNANRLRLFKVSSR